MGSLCKMQDLVRRVGAVGGKLGVKSGAYD